MNTREEAVDLLEKILKQLNMLKRYLDSSTEQDDEEDVEL